MDKSFDLSKLLRAHEKQHKSKPSQFVSVALGVKNRLEKCNKKRRSSRLTIFDKIRNIPKCVSPIPLQTEQKLKLAHRMKQLEKWKEEKQKKKLEAAAQKKKPFVAGVPNKPLTFVPPPPAKPMPSTSGRITCSRTSRIEKAKVPKTDVKSTKSFAPKNAKFNPVLNQIVKLPLEIPKNGITKINPVMKIDGKVKTRSVKPNSSIKTDTNVNNKTDRKKTTSETCSSFSSTSTESDQKHKLGKQNLKNTKVNKSPLKSSNSSDSEPSLIQKHKLKKNSTNSKNNVHKQSIRGSSSSDTSIQPQEQLIKSPRKPSRNSKATTPKKSIPKSESSSEEKLRSPKLPMDLPMTPEQIVEVVQKLPSPCVTMSRGKDNARKEMRKKIDEGLLDDDVCEMDSLDHFKQQLDSEIKRMTEMCNTWEKISEQVSLPETVQEAVLGAVGQARLLMSKKLQQFASLLARAEQPEPGMALVTPTDLHGFWDMVFMQVENIDMRFKKLEEMRARGWADEPPPARPAVRPARRERARPQPRPAASGLKDLIAAKRREKMAQDQTQCAVAESKTFEAGFFSVQSPVRVSSPAPRSSDSDRRSLLQAVLSSETKKASANKNASYAILRASSICRNVGSDDSMFMSHPVPLIPVNLCATPARSILKLVGSQSTRKSGKKSIKMVLFNNSDADAENTSVDEEPVEQGIVNEAEDINQNNDDRRQSICSHTEENKILDHLQKPRLVRQDAIEDRSPVMTRSRRKSMQTPLLDGKSEKTPRRSRRKHALQEIDVNINTVEEKVMTPRKSSRRKSSMTLVD